jgi:hypothetical protein
LIIGLGYRARSGKDTIADYLVERHGFVKAAFADTLKEACRAIFGLTNEQLYGAHKEQLDIFWHDTPRRILQLVGTECLRKGYADDVWIRALQRRIGFGDLAHHRKIVIVDARFPNEVEAIKGWGGVAVRVDRPGAGASGGVEAHASEHALDSWTGWDHVLVNDSTLEVLHERASAMVTAMRSIGRIIP